MTWNFLWSCINLYNIHYSTILLTVILYDWQPFIIQQREAESVQLILNMNIAPFWPSGLAKLTQLYESIELMFTLGKKDLIQNDSRTEQLSYEPMV